MIRREWVRTVRGATTGALFVFAATSASGFEKTPIRAPDVKGWTASSADVTVRYYNTCTGWALSWDLGTFARAGVAFQCPSGGPWTLTASDLTFDGTTRFGYGYTGTLGVYAADSAGCPVGAPLVWQPFLPDDGVNHYTWNISVPPSFVLASQTGSAGGHPFVLRSRFVTDHPGHGPTGPPACGTCYSASRITHSFYYGHGSTSLCPGTPYFDGFCNAELLWSVTLSGTATPAPEGAESRSWSAIKSLYR